MDVIGKIFLICAILIFTIFIVMILVIGFAGAWIDLQEKRKRIKDKEKELYEQQ